MTDGTPISGLGPHHGRRQQETSPFRVRRTVGFSLNSAPGPENRWTRLSIASPSSTYSRHRVAAAGLAADPTTASESALPSTIRPDAPGWRSRGGAASGHLAPLPHNPATPHPARPRRSLQPRAQIAPVPCSLIVQPRRWICASSTRRPGTHGSEPRRCRSGTLRRLLDAPMAPEFIVQQALGAGVLCVCCQPPADSRWFGRGSTSTER
jgi:hypothetical protein